MASSWSRRPEDDELDERKSGNAVSSLKEKEKVKKELQDAQKDESGGTNHKIGERSSLIRLKVNG